MPSLDAGIPGAVNLWTGAAPTPDRVSSGVEPFLVPHPVGGRPRGAVVICPGGGYGMLAEHEAFPIAQWLNDSGIGAFILRYRHAPHRHPVPLMDAQRAVRQVRARAKEWNVAPGRVGILGFSAGGHLAATAATHFDAGNPLAADPVERQSCRPDAAVLCYAVISFGQHTHQGTINNLLGPNPPDEIRQALSNELQVTPQSPPAFLWHSADDGAVPVQNSLFYADALSRNKVPFELHVFPHAPHGVGLAPTDPIVGQWPALCAKWLVGQGF
jgi:acetyl esterase/lipase